MQPRTDASHAADPLTGDDSPADLWRLMVDAARRDDQAMATVYFRRWCAIASEIVDRICDQLLDQHGKP